MAFWRPCSQTIETIIPIGEGFIQKRRQRSLLLLGGQKCFNSLPCLLFWTRMIWKGWIVLGWYEEKDELHQDDLRKRMKCTRMVWRKWWIHTIIQMVLVQNSLRGKELMKFCPPKSGHDLCLRFCTNPSSIILTYKWFQAPAYVISGRLLAKTHPSIFLPKKSVRRVKKLPSVSA